MKVLSDVLCTGYPAPALGCFGDEDILPPVVCEFPHENMVSFSDYCRLSSADHKVAYSWLFMSVHNVQTWDIISHDMLA